MIKNLLCFTLVFSALLICLPQNSWSQITPGTEFTPIQPHTRGGQSTGCPASERYPYHPIDCKKETVNAQGEAGPKGLSYGCAGGCCQCEGPIQNNHVKIRSHVSGEFVKHRHWMIDEFFTKHILPAMAMMTSQLSAVAIQQVQMIGTFFDAKHQLETQGLMQQLMAEAHKDYQPSEGICEIGTISRSLAGSQRKSDLIHVAVSKRTTARTLRNKDNLAGAGENSDIYSRIDRFTKDTCNAADNGNGLASLCDASVVKDGGGGGESNANSGNTNSNSTNNNASSNNNGPNTALNDNNSHNNSDDVNIEVNESNNNSSNQSNQTPSSFLVRDNDPEGGKLENVKMFDIISKNEGNDYNNLTGTYTAPVDGSYSFSAYVVTLGSLGGSAHIEKNGEILKSVTIETPQKQSIAIDTSADLRKGDRITLHTDNDLDISMNTNTHSFRGKITSQEGNNVSADGNDNSDVSIDGNGIGTSGPSNNSQDKKERINKDVNFTRALESDLTLDVDLTDEEVTPEEADLFAFMANIMGHTPLPIIANGVLATSGGNPKAGSKNYMDLRSIAAKRSVAQNSIAAMVSDKAAGEKEAAPYLKKLVVELGIPEAEVESIVGEDPSYFAQMEVLTKSLYQNPVFYTELYDKPANVTRKSVAMRAIGLMQERDLFESQLRSEAVLSVLLETMLLDEHNRVSGNLSDLAPEGETNE